MDIGISRGRAVERIARACRRYDQNERTMRAALLEEIRTAIGFDAYAWLLTDPETEVGCAPLADVPCLPELPRLIRLKYLTTVNRWTRLESSVGLLQVGTGGHPGRSLVWRELLRAYDVTDVASLVFRDRFGCWSFLDLWRIGGGRHFNESEAQLLASLTAPICEALRRCQARTFDTVTSTPGPTGPVALVLSPDLDVRAQTVDAKRFLRILIPSEADRAPIPAGAYNVAAQLLAVEAGVDGHRPSARVHLTGGTWLTMRAARMDAPGPIDGRDIAVTIEPTTTSDRISLFVRTSGLTEREAQLISHLAAGSDTRGIAELMYLSQNTVQDHLKSIFTKTGTHSRRTLLARAIGG